MAKKRRYSMPDDRDRTDHAKVRATPDRAIDYADIAPLTHLSWRGKPARKSRPASRRAHARRALAAE
jgi:hypothetical protein